MYFPVISMSVLNEPTCPLETQLVSIERRPVQSQHVHTEQQEVQAPCWQHGLVCPLGSVTESSFRSVFDWTSLCCPLHHQLWDWPLLYLVGQESETAVNFRSTFSKQKPHLESESECNTAERHNRTKSALIWWLWEYALAFLASDRFM